jgi:shikimate dehydrogenase
MPRMDVFGEVVLKAYSATRNALICCNLLQANGGAMSDQRQRPVTAATRLACLIGHPVDHSRSPLMHNAAFKAQGIDMRYVAFDVSSERLPAAIEGLRALGIVGANVTVPHKEAVVPLLDTVDSTAGRIGAVNTIVNQDGVLTGHNTDIHGFLAALEQAWARSPRGSRCLVLGAGGSARAIVAGLVLEGAAEVWVFNRTLSRARELCAAVASWSTVPCRAVGESELITVAQQAELIVNATSVGMGDSVKLSPIPVDILTRRHVIVDLTYGPEPTALVRAGRSLGGICLDGLEMLVRQAARSYELWTGRMAPIDRMREEVQHR